MLTTDIVHRVSLNEVIEHPWMLEHGTIADLKRSVASAMKAYSEAQPFARRIMEGLVKSEFIPPNEFEMYMKQFSKLDKSGDGQLDVEELLEILQTADTEVTLEDAEYMIQCFTAESQTVAIADLCIAKVMTKARSHVSRLGNIFKMLDKSNDGQLSMQELTEGFAELLGSTLQQHELTQLITELDSNGNGMIDYNEFLASFYRLSGHDVNE